MNKKDRKLENIKNIERGVHLQNKYWEFTKKFNKNLFDLNNNYSNIVVLCIGTNSIIGDSVGPIVGTFLKPLENDNLKIYGDMQNTLNFGNARSIINDIYRNYEKPYIITVDAALSSSKVVGDIVLSKGYIKIGKALEKSICFYSNINIKCVVENVGDIVAIGKLRLYIANASDNSSIGYVENGVTIYDDVDFETSFEIPLAQHFAVGESYNCYLYYVDDLNNETPVTTSLEPFRFTVVGENAPRKQLAFGYYDTADSKGGITVENSKIFSGWSQNVMIHNLTNYNDEAMTAYVGIALFDESGSFYKICNYGTVGLNSKTYTSECEIAAGFCSLDSYEDGAYYFEAMSREQYEGMSYDWIHFQQTSRIYVQKYGDWVYVYDPENYLKVNGITFSNAPIQDANVSVAVDLENYAYTAASGSLEYRVYEKDYSNNPLVSGTIDVNVATESTVDIPFELAGGQFAIGKEYELEISGYKDNADPDKTFVGRTLPFVVLDPSGVDSMTANSSVYPNPIVGNVTVTAVSPIVSVELFSVDGRRMLTAQADGQTSLNMDLSQVPSGVYVVMVRTENGTERHRVIRK